MPSQYHGKFIWCELMTTDMAAARAFYSAVVGWEASSMPMPGVEGAEYGIFGIKVGERDRGVAGMMVIPPEMAGQMPPNWTGYVAVDDVDATAKAFAEAGGAVRRPPQDIPDIGRFAVVADPHGAVICIMTPAPMDTPPPEVAPGTPGLVGWHELYAGNGEEALSFYGAMFGWVKHHEFDMGPMGKYLIFAHQGEAVGGMMTRPPQVPVACWSNYFSVPSVEAALATIQARGGSVVHGPQEVPGDSVILQAIDPQGAHFALVGPK
ncbi:VOC family protein [Rhizobium oryzicola]|uniref:VOC family protein n=1 Tax=Rhizobium oryzicola TaxID=1232668 RepID=A0ABT8SSN2_9HYPH|nr:VOC family protein [Rhizobium oryzicola]MDO1581430.1 VOC family protein [Rhizobium oryzicola]